jgi:hypothetical protein
MYLLYSAVPLSDDSRCMFTGAFVNSYSSVVNDAKVAVGTKD